MFYDPRSIHFIVTIHQLTLLTVVGSHRVYKEKPKTSAIKTSTNPWKFRSSFDINLKRIFHFPSVYFFTFTRMNKSIIQVIIQVRIFSPEL